MDVDMKQMLDALMDADNAVRRSAEHFFTERLNTDGVGMVQTLLSIFSDTSCITIHRSFAGVLLRRAVEKCQFSAEKNVELRSLLTHLWKNETDITLLKRLAHIMAQSAMNSSWVELLPQVLDSATKQLDAQKQIAAITAALMLVEIVTEHCPQDILTHVQLLGQFLSSQLGAAVPAIQVGCAKSTCACIIALENDGAREAFKPAIQPIINILGATLARCDEVDATSIMEYLVTIAQVQPIFFKGTIDAVVQAMLTVAKSDDLEFGTRSIALELLVTLTETAPALARRCPGLVQGLVPLAMNIMLDVDETEAEWMAGKYSQELVEENYFVGEEALERAAAGMGGRMLAPTILSLCQQFAGHAKWTHRRAAVAALCRLAEGSSATFKNYFDQSVQYLLGALQDTSARVRYQAVETLGRFAALFTQNVQLLVTTFVPGLTTMLGQEAICDRLRGHVASALINLTNPESCDAEYLVEAGLLEPLLSSLVVCLQNASLEVQPYCLDLLGCVAQVSGGNFTPYYASFMPGIKNILVTAQGPLLVKLRGKAMDCVGLIGDAVGSSVFSQDAADVMRLLIKDLKSSSAEAQDVAFDYILPACARIARALGVSFSPFLSDVMAPLLAGASQVITCTIEDAGDEDNEGEAIKDEETGMESAVMSVGGLKKRVTMNTYAVHQKDQAARMLFEFAEALKGDLAPHLMPAIEVTLSMITDKHSSDMRASAALALAKLFEAALDAASKSYLDSSALGGVLQSSLNRLLESQKGEINGSARACSADALSDILLACYNSAEEQVDGGRNSSSVIIRPDVSNSQVIVSELLERCTESIKRRLDREHSFQSNEGLDAEDKSAFEEEIEEEDELLSSLSTSIGMLLKLHSDTGALMSHFDSFVVPVFSPYMIPSTAKKQHCEHFQIVACCLLDDIIEFGGERATKYVAQCTNQFLENVATSGNNVLRQCSAYGLAQIIRLHQDVLLSALGGDISCITNGLLTLIGREDSKDDDNEGATENAVFGLGILVTAPAFRPCVASMKQSSASLLQMTKMWLHGLPLRADEIEAKHSTHLLCNALEIGDVNIFGGTQFTNLPDILRIIAEVLNQAQKLASAATEENSEIIFAHPLTVQRALHAVKSIASGVSVPPEIAHQAFGSLSSTHQAVLNQALAA